MKYPKLWSDEVEQKVRAAGINLDRQERPSGPVQMCTRCVMTNQRPRITFDEEGVCSACRYADRKKHEIDWAARGKKLDALLDRHRGDSWDVVVPCSGGKDSSWVAWQLREAGMNPLLARWAPHIVTDVGERNWQSLLHHGFDGVTAQPNGILHRKLSRLALEFVGDPFLPFIWGQLAWPFHVALQNGIKLVFFGENGEAEYGGDSAANNKPCWDEKNWERVYMKDTSLKFLMSLGYELGAISKDEDNHAAAWYLLPMCEPRQFFPEFHWMGYYKPWHPQANYYHAAEHTGFKPCEHRSEGTYSRYASIDDKLDGLHYYFAYLKFGIGRCTSDAAHEIRDGDLTREEGLKLVHKYDGEIPFDHMKECLEYLGITEDHMVNIVDRFTGAQGADHGQADSKKEKQATG